MLRVEHRVFFHSREDLAVYVREALEIVDEADVPADLVPHVLPTLIQLRSAAHVEFGHVQTNGLGIVTPMPPRTA